MEKRMKKAAIIALIVAGVLIAAAVIFGVLNALVADGKWTFGWNDYRYDETGYTVGDGTIPSEALTGISLDWIDGNVEIIPCQDTFISVSESSAEELPESARLRWKVEADGTLSIKYRKSSWFFGVGENNQNKKLILRVPERFFSQLSEIEVDAVSANVSVRDLSVISLDCSLVSGNLTIENCAFSDLSIETVSGKMNGTVTVKNLLLLESVSGDLNLRNSICPQKVDIESTSGDVTLLLPNDSDFELLWESVSGNLSYDLPLTKSDDRYICGDATAKFDVETVSGDLILGVYK